MPASSRTRVIALTLVASVLATGGLLMAQTREAGLWWPSVHGAKDQGGNILENLDLSQLARDRVYEFLYLTLTERIKGATGSPVRPLAIR